VVRSRSLKERHVKGILSTARTKFDPIWLLTSTGSMRHVHLFFWNFSFFNVNGNIREVVVGATGPMKIVRNLFDFIKTGLLYYGTRDIQNSSSQN